MPGWDSDYNAFTKNPINYIVRAQIFVCKAIDNTYPTVCNIYGKALFTPPTRKGLGTKLVAYFLLPVFSFFHVFDFRTMKLRLNVKKLYLLHCYLHVVS